MERVELRISLGRSKAFFQRRARRSGKRSRKGWSQNAALGVIMSTHRRRCRESPKIQNKNSGAPRIQRKRRIQKLVFLRARVAMPPRRRSKFGFGVSGERESFRGAHGFESGKSPSGAGINRRGSTRRRRPQVRRQNTLRLDCKLRRAGATGEGRDGRPRESRIFRATIGSSMTARIRMRERHRGHSRTSSRNTRAFNRAERRLKTDHAKK